MAAAESEGESEDTSTPRREPVWRKALIPILIAAVSVTAAAFTWRAASLGGQASGNDERAITESAIQAKNQARVENQVGYELEAFARYLENQVLADQLEAESKRPNVTGQDAAALQAQARSTRGVAQDIAALYFDRHQYVDDSGRSFDVEKRRQDLLRDDLEAQRVVPEHTAARAAAIREREERVVRFIVILALVVVALTIAQTVGRATLRLWIAGFGTAVWIVATAVALLGDRG